MKTNETNKNEVKAVREESTGRECYAFALYVKGEIKQFITADWWMNQHDAERTAEGMAVAARMTAKTAGVAVYQLQDNGEYWLIAERDLYAERTLFKFHKSRLNFPHFIAPTHEEEREAHRRNLWDFYSGADRLPVGWMNETTEQR